MKFAILFRPAPLLNRSKALYVSIEFRPNDWPRARKRLADDLLQNPISNRPVLLGAALVYP